MEHCYLLMSDITYMPELTQPLIFLLFGGCIEVKVCVIKLLNITQRRFKN